MRKFLFAIALALPLAAEDSPRPALERLANRLASDDPEVRSAAREEALSLGLERADDLEAHSFLVTDAEARAALREIAELIRDRAVLEVARRILNSGFPVEEWVRREGVEALPALVRVFEHPEEFVANAYASQAAVQVLTSEMIEALTFAPARGSEEGWRDFLTLHSGASLDEIRSRELEKAGYRVRDADLYRRASHLASAKRWIESRRSEATGRSMTEYLSLRYDASVPGCGDDDRGQLEEWIAANKGFLVEAERKIATRAPIEHYVDLLSSNHRLRVRGALRALFEAPTAVPDTAWDLTERHADLVFPLMARAGKRPPDEIFGRLLTVARDSWEHTDFLPIWREEQLIRWLQESDPSDVRRATVFAILNEIGGKQGLDAVAEALRDTQFCEPEPGRNVGEVALELLGKATDPSQLDEIAAWARDAEPSHERRQVVFALFKIGHRSGLELAVALAAERKLVPVECAWVREQVDGAPEGYSRDEWSRWATLGSDRYVWREAEKRWGFRK
ncbi:MAG: hypothetical protein FD180_1231 [Planctomycetota bacterium]|nr:MAG: hypothetical protein FD180_1231 [Planctomycetota bacterium]